MADAAKPVRCAIYTRKSSEEGLDQAFNSLDAQREACEAYILSQKHEGWRLLPASYDDGGFSGGTMERPGLKALMAAVDQGYVDTIVVYKVDRLTRSLSDFARMVERFDANAVSFVSVTQAFNTTSSMGRLTLNVLLSFAQFEREVTGERIRDKIAASKAKGMWMGGNVPLGYDVRDRLLVVNEAEAAQVRMLYERYLALAAVDALVIEAAARGITGKARAGAAAGTPLGRGSLYRILANPIYAGEIGHKGKRYKGQHEGIMPRALHDAVQALLAGNRRKQRGSRSGDACSLLSGLVTGADGQRLTATHTAKAGRRYRYYAGGTLRLPAERLDRLVCEALAKRLGDPVAFAAILPDVTAISPAVIAAGARIAGKLAGCDRDALRALVVALIERVEVTDKAIGIGIRLQPLGLDGTAALAVPAAIAKTGTRLALVVPGPHQPQPDAALVAMMAQGRAWLDALTSGAQPSLAAIATQHGVTQTHVRRLIDCAFIAPDLVTRIVEGRQPAALDAARLRTMLPLPANWDQQRTMIEALG